MQTVVRDPKDVIIQAILIKVHKEKPTPNCKEYKLIRELLEALEKEETTKQQQDQMVKDNLATFTKDDGNTGMKQDAYMEE